MTELTRELADRLIADCGKYAYHELVAYANGITIGEMRDALERGAVVDEKERDPQQRELRRFTREYCRADAGFSREIFKELLGQKPAEAMGVTRGGNIIRDKAQSPKETRPLWAWFERRWPCGSPLAIGSLLSGQRVEQLAMDEALDNPNAEIAGSLQRCGYFRADDLEQPGEGLRRALARAGYKRDAEPQPSPPAKG